MRWFNSLPINNAFSKSQDWIFNHKMTAELFDNGTDIVYNDWKGGRVQPWKVMQGDMVVHFAGANPVRDSWMAPWLERAEAYLPEWSNVTKQQDLKIEAQKFWNMTADRMVWERGQGKGKAFDKLRAKVTGRPPTGVAASSMMKPSKAELKAPTVSSPVHELKKDSETQLKENERFRNESTVNL